MEHIWRVPSLGPHLSSRGEGEGGGEGCYREERGGLERKAISQALWMERRIQLCWTTVRRMTSRCVGEDMSSRNVNL